MVAVVGIQILDGHDAGAQVGNDLGEVAVKLVETLLKRGALAAPQDTAVHEAGLREWVHKAEQGVTRYAQTRIDSHDSK